MTREEADRVIEINKEMSTIEKRYRDLEFQDEFSQPTQLSIKGIGRFFSRIFGSRPYEHYTTKEETLLMINFLQRYRKRQLRELDRELVEL